MDVKIPVIGLFDRDSLVLVTVILIGADVMLISTGRAGFELRLVLRGLYVFYAEIFIKFFVILVNRGAAAAQLATLNRNFACPAHETNRILG